MSCVHWHRGVLRRRLRGHRKNPRGRVTLATGDASLGEEGYTLTVSDKGVVIHAATSAGFFYGILNGESPEEAVKLGWAHGALLTTFPGDTTMATFDQVRALAKGGSARIQR